MAHPEQQMYNSLWDADQRRMKDEIRRQFGDRSDPTNKRIYRPWFHARAAIKPGTAWATTGSVTREVTFEEFMRRTHGAGFPLELLKDATGFYEIDLDVPPTCGIDQNAIRREELDNAVASVADIYRLAGLLR